MQVINKYVCKDVCGIISEYLNGDKKHWKDEFKETINFINEKNFKYEILQKFEDVPFYVCNSCHFVANGFSSYILEHNCIAGYAQNMNTLVNKIAKCLHNIQYNSDKYYFGIRALNISAYKNKCLSLKQKKGKYKRIFPTRKDEQHYDNFIFKLF